MSCPTAPENGYIPDQLYNHSCQLYACRHQQHPIASILTLTMNQSLDALATYSVNVSRMPITLFFYKQSACMSWQLTHSFCPTLQSTSVTLPVWMFKKINNNKYLMAEHLFLQLNSASEVLNAI